MFHYFGHCYLREEKSMIHSFTVTIEAKYLTGMVTSVPPYESFSLFKNDILHPSKNYKNHLKNSNFWDVWPLGHVGHVTYSFIFMLFNFKGDLCFWFYGKLRPQILTVGTTANAPLNKNCVFLSDRGLYLHFFRFWYDCYSNRCLPWFIHILIGKPRLIVIYTHTLYREDTPYRDFYTYSLWWSHA